jgi:hypothetical protein
MSELAWLSYFRGEWLLVTREGGDEIRTWGDKERALRDLENEGWTVGSARSLRYDRHGRERRRLIGYSLRRSIH